MIAFKSWNDPELVYYIEIYTKIDQIIAVSERRSKVVTGSDHVYNAGAEIWR